MDAINDCAGSGIHPLIQRAPAVLAGEPQLSCAQGEIRTLTGLLPTAFKAVASTVPPPGLGLGC